MEQKTMKTLKDFDNYLVTDIDKGEDFTRKAIDLIDLRQLAIERYKHWKIIRGTTINGYTTSCELLGRMAELKELFGLTDEELK